MKQPKRIIAITVALMLGSSLVLSGCSGSGSDKQELSILFNYANESDQGAIEKIISNFKAANPDVTVTSQGLVVDKFYSTLQTRVSANDAPNVVLIPVGSIPAYAAKGVLADLSTYLSADTLSHFNEARLSVDKQDGKIAGLPMADSVRGVIYNKTAFDKVGITPPGAGDKPWTWDELVAAARAVQDAGEVQYGLQFEKPSMDGWMPYLFQSGATLFDANGEPSVDSAKGIAALQWTRDLYTEGIAVPGVVEGTVDPVQSFLSGNVGLWLSGGSFQIPVMIAQATGFDWGATFLPSKEKTTTLVGGSDFIAFKGGDAALSAKFIEFAAQADQIVLYDDATASLSPRNDAVLGQSARPDVIEVFAQQQQMLDPTLNEQVYTVAYGSAKDGMLRELQSVIIGEQSPADGAKRMSDLLRDALAQN